ncbi:hypothetical protein [Parvularcula sp. LCG005]|uniref:hypothetical protein n=1 Tax=Parvularcula sp. LCG005 TaxID=3078805 RepID=UPI00294366F6|nr:hypothetical protein [Parvularcula sp. LCG005]WOI52416.1 hypothetical protein RUI03_09670 [Parvularcula sp. LCG005]
MRLKDYENRVARWLRACFAPAIAESKEERVTRFLEEALELVQSEGFDRDRVYRMVEYVFDRSPGDPAQEVGGVIITLAAYSGVAGIDLEDAAVKELVRIEHPDIMAKIREKHVAKGAVEGIVAAT